MTLHAPGTQRSPLILDNDTTAYGIAPSGTVGTGSSGHWTAGTAFDRTRSEGVWLYIGAVASTPALTAGWYWVVMSSTTVGTIYTNGPGSAAYNFSVGAANTGVITEQVLPKTAVTVPAGAMGASGQIDVAALVSLNNTAGNRTFRAKLGGTTLLTAILNSTFGYEPIGSIFNRGAGLQVGQAGWTTVTQSGAAPTAAIDTTAATSLTFSIQIATATDWGIFERLGSLLRV